MPFTRSILAAIKPLFKTMFKDVFSFNGRIRRAEFCLTFLIYCIAVIGYGRLIDAVTAPVMSESEIVLLFTITSLFIIVVGWCMISQVAKRSHDLGESVWEATRLTHFLKLFYKQGQTQTNRYGTDPRVSSNHRSKLDRLR